MTLTEFVDSGDDDYEQIQSQRKKARAKAKKPKRKPKAPVYAYSSSDSSDEQEEVLAVVKRRRPKKKAVRIIYEDELLGAGYSEEDLARGRSVYEFSVGQEVECLIAPDKWQLGDVTCIAPLKVKKRGDFWAKE